MPRTHLTVLIGVMGLVRLVPATARDADLTLDLIQYPISSRPVIVTASSHFDLVLSHHIDINGVRVDLIRNGETLTVFTSDPHAVYKVTERSTFDLPSWDCLVDGWKMSWMWRPRTVVRDRVVVPVALPAGVPAGLYDLRVICSAGVDSSRRAVCVLATWPHEYRIVQITDAHLNRDDMDRRPRILERLAAAINALQPAFVLNTGDNTDHNYPDEHEAFYKFLDLFEVPTFSVGGNHDLGGKVYEGHADTLLYSGEPYYSFDFDAHHYTGIDNASRFFDEEQVAWIKEDLAKAQDRRLRVLFGHALYLQSEKDEMWFSEQLFPHYRVALHLQGHWHRNFIETRFDGQTHWVGTAPAFDGHYAVITIRGDAVASVEHVQLNPLPE